MQFPGTRVFEQRRPSEQNGSGCKETSVKLKRPKQSEWMVGIKARETLQVRGQTEAHCGLPLVFGVKSDPQWTDAGHDYDLAYLLDHNSTSRRKGHRRENRRKDVTDSQAEWWQWLGTGWGWER